MLLRLLLSFSLFFLGSLTCSAADDSIVLKDINGKVHRFSDYRGKWIVVNFWATWCPPCQQELPELQSLNEEHQGRDLVVIGVAMHYASPREVADFVATRGINFPVVLGDRHLSNEFGGVSGMPTSYIIDPAGEAVGYQPGTITKRDIDAFIKANTEKNRNGPR